MLSRLTDVDLPDVTSIGQRRSDLGSAAGLLGVGAGVAAAGVCVAPAAPLASAVLPTVASLYMEESAETVAEAAETRLRELGQRFDDPDTRRGAALAKCSRAGCRVLDPIVPDDADADTAAEMAATDPEAFTTLVRRVFESDPDALERIEDDLRRLLAADPDEDDVDPEAVVDRVRDTFGVDSRQEAVRLLYLYRKFLGDLGSRAGEETDDPEVRETLAGLDACLDSMENSVDRVLDELLAVELEDGHGFEQWTIGTLQARRPFEGTDPRDAWGFGRLDLADLVAAADPDHEFEVGDLRADDGDPPFRRQVLEDLRAGDGPIVLTAGPECGKSTVCRRVAHEWVDRDHGTVFYRGSEARQPFTGERALLTGIDEAQDVGDGVPLVVVEDATRESARAVFEVIERSLDHERDVAFLLDARTSEWERFRSEVAGDHVVDREFDESPIDRRELPELSVATCRSARTAFNQLPGAFYRPHAEALHRSVTENTPSDRRAYELSTLATELRREGLDAEGTPLAQSAADAYAAAVGPLEDDVDDLEDLQDADDRAVRRALLATAVNLLNAAEYPVEPELLSSLAFVDPAVGGADADALAEGVADLLDCLTSPPDEGGLNRQMVRTGEVVRLAPLETRPPSWSTAFLEAATEGRSTGTPAIRPLVVAAGAAMLGLAADPRTEVEVPGLTGADADARRRQLARALVELAGDRVTAPDGDGYLKRLGQTPDETARTLLTRVYEWAQRGLFGLDGESWRRELLRPTDDASDEDEVATALGVAGDVDGGPDDTLRLHDLVPDCYGPALAYDLRRRLGYGGDAERRLDGLDELRAEVEGDDDISETARHELLGEIDVQRASEMSDLVVTPDNEITDDDRVACRVSAAEHLACAGRHGDAIWQYENAAVVVDDLDRETDLLERAVDRAERAGDNPTSVYSKLVSSCVRAGDNELAEEYCTEALDRYGDEDEAAVAEMHRTLGSAYAGSAGGDESDSFAERTAAIRATKRADEHLEEAVDRFERLGHHTEAAETYQRMASLYEETDTKDPEETLAQHRQAIEAYERAEDIGVAFACRRAAELCHETLSDRERAAEFYERAARRFEAAGADETSDVTSAAADEMVADTYHDTARMYEETDPERAERYYERALERYEEVAHRRDTVEVYRGLARVHERSDPETARDYRERAIDRHESAGDTRSAAETAREIAEDAEDVETAVAFSRRAIELYETARGDTTSDVVGVHNSLGKALLEHGDLERGTRHYLSAVKTGHEQQPGSVLVTPVLDDYTTAVGLFRGAGTIDVDDLTPSAASDAVDLLETAADGLRRADHSGTRPHETKARTVAGRLYSECLAEPAAAREQFTRALELWSELDPDLYTVGLVRLRLATIEADLGNVDAAVEWAVTGLADAGRTLSDPDSASIGGRVPFERLVTLGRQTLETVRSADPDPVTRREAADAGTRLLSAYRDIAGDHADESLCDSVRTVCDDLRA